MAQIIRLSDDWQMAGLLASLDSASDSVVLVLPPHDRSLANPARMQLIRRRAARRRLRLALVSGDLATQQFAREAGIPVFFTAQDASRIDQLPPLEIEPLPEDPQAARRAWLTQWRLARARERSQIISRGRPRPISIWGELVMLTLVLAGLASMVALSAALLVPAAYVTLVPARRTMAVTVDLVATTGVDAPDADARLLPARRIELQIEGNGSQSTTGRRDAPDQRATGTVLFLNRQATSQEIPIGTLVRTPTGTNVRFRTTAPATLGPGIGSTATAPIEAVDPGPSGNIRSGAITQVDGPLATVVRVINEQPTTSGSVRQVSVVTNADKDGLRQAVLQQMQQTALQRLSEAMQPGEFLPPESVTTLVLAETFDHFVDEPTETLGLRLRVLASGLAVDGKAAEEIAAQAMRTQSPGLADALPDRVRYQRGAMTVQEERISFSETATGEIVSDINQAEVRAAIAGLSLDEARAVLAQRWSLAGEPELRLEPDWIGRVPWVPFRIRVLVNLASG
jgi:hypothetical protein